MAAIFTDGTRVEGDLVIGADGFRSAVRNSIMPEVQPKYAGVHRVARHGRRKRDAAKLHGEIFERCVETAHGPEYHMLHAYGLPEGEFMTIYPVPGHDNDIRRGHRRSNFVWYHPVDEQELAQLCTDVNGHCHGSAIPPHLIRPEEVARMQHQARQLFAPQIAQLVEMAQQKFFQAIFDMESPSVVSGRVALLGDAAFVARPHVGMGTTKAALDAQYLGDALLAHGSDIAGALRQYDERVRAFGTRAVERGRWLGAHLEAQITKPRAQRSAHELAHMPLDKLLREVGAALRDIPALAEVA